MVVSRLVWILLLVIPELAFAQTNRYVVHFKDKVGTPFTLDHPEQFLSTRSIARRTKQNIALTADDLPPNPDYVNQVKATGARTFYTSRWLNCLLVEVGADSVPTLQALPFVSSIELAAPDKKLKGGRIKKNKKSATQITDGQLKQLGIDVMHAQGYHGEGVAIAVMDAGFPTVNTSAPFQQLFSNHQIKDAYDFIGNTGNVFQYDSHGTEVLSIIAAQVPDQYVGGAYGADFYLYVTEDVQTEYRIEEYNWLFAAEHADSAGVDIMTTSLGYTQFDDSSMDYKYANLDGKTTVITRATNFAATAGIVVVCAAGNEGNASWHYISAPADAPGILAVGAVYSNGGKTPFSSVGPTSDNRIKPDVMALGFGTQVINTFGTIGSESGTSVAAPLIACLAAGVRQAFPDKTSKEVQSIIVQSGDQYSAPDNSKGYGIPNFARVITAVDPIQAVEAVEIFPNPVYSPTFEILLKDPKGESVTVTIYDRLGKILSVSTQVVTTLNNPLEVDTNGMSSGMYIIKVESPSLSKTLKWIKI